MNNSSTQGLPNTYLHRQLFKSLGSVKSFYIFERDVLCLPWLYLYDLKKKKSEKSIPVMLKHELSTAIPSVSYNSQN